MDMWLEQADNIERWESNSLTASDRRVLITQWVGAAMEELDSREEYRFRLFEKCGMAMTVDGSGDDRITLEGLDKPYTFAGDGDSSDDEGSSETGNDGCGGGDDQTVEGEGDHSGEGVEDGDSSDEDTRGKLDAYQGFSLHCLVVVAVAVAFALAVAVKSTDICMRR